MVGEAAGGERMASTQTFVERLPVSRLSRYITCVWIQQVLPDSIPYTHHTVPNGSAELTCEVGAAAKIVGPQTSPTEETLAPGTTVVGVRFRPGAAPAALDVPASELVDLVVPAEELWGRGAARLGEEIAASASPTDAAAILEAEVVARLADESHLDPVAAETVRHLLPGCMNEVSTLASSLCISERQLRRRCLTAIGVTPKVLHRMLRFQGFLALLGRHERPRTKLAFLAAEAGYADQAHLSRESLRLAGRSPRTLVREAEHHCRAAHDHSASYEPLLRWRGGRDLSPEL